VEILRSDQDKKLTRLVSSPLFVGFKAFEGGITAVHMLKSTVTLNKPIFVGQAILDISKAMMYNFWYGYIKPRYGDKARLLYTDTDSLIMWIETEDIYKDRAERPDIFDLDYSGDLFLMKDETKGDPIGEAVCLKPKMYSVLPAGHDPNTPKTDADFEKELEDEETRKSQGIKDWQKKHGMQKAKGVKKCVVKRELRHDKFLKCLETRKLTRHDMYGLRSYDHQIYLERVNKVGLNPYDNKRWILLNGIRTLPYGHWRIYAYKRMVSSGMSPEEAEKRAMMVKLKAR